MNKYFISTVLKFSGVSGTCADGNVIQMPSYDTVDKVEYKKVP